MPITFDSEKTYGWVVNSVAVTGEITSALWDNYRESSGALTISNSHSLYYTPTSNSTPYVFTDPYRITVKHTPEIGVSTAYISEGLYAHSNSGTTGIITNDLNVTCAIDYSLSQSRPVYTISNGEYFHLHSSNDLNCIFTSNLKRSRLKNNLIIQRKSRVSDTSLHKNLPENEKNALETLREIISETEFRKYLKYGFILVRGNSGDTYQIFKNKSHTKIWRGGKLIEEVCVRIKDIGIPHTDNVIAFKTMIETDEQDFKSCGNVYKMQKVA